MNFVLDIAGRMHENLLEFKKNALVNFHAIKQKSQEKYLLGLKKVLDALWIV